MIRNSVCIAEFKAICLTDETRLWSIELSDQQAEHRRCVTEMHVRFSEKDKISRQCSDEEGCLYTNLRDVEWNVPLFSTRANSAQDHTTRM